MGEGPGNKCPGPGKERSRSPGENGDVRPALLSGCQEETALPEARKGKVLLLPLPIILAGVAVLISSIALVKTLTNDPASDGLNRKTGPWTKTEAPPVETVNLLVASRPLAMGMVIQDPRECFTVLPVVKGREPANAYTEGDYERLKGRRLVDRLAKGQIAFPENLLDKSKNSLFIGMPKGLRAVGIQVDIRGVPGGFASLPMSRVDIISTIRRGDNDFVSQVILKDVLVLEAGERTQRVDDLSRMTTITVTVALSPEDAELVALAQEMGKLRLILRPQKE